MGGDITTIDLHCDANSKPSKAGKSCNTQSCSMIEDNNLESGAMQLTVMFAIVVFALLF